jgi:CheY-like chemotaxis protein
MTAPPSGPLRVLVVADSEAERRALAAALEDATVPVVTESVSRLEDALERLARPDLPALDAALLDLDALRRVAIRKEVAEIMAPAKETLAQAKEIVKQMEEKVEALAPAASGKSTPASGT